MNWFRRGDRHAGALRSLVVLLLSALPLGSASAEPESRYERTGYYLRAGAAAGFFEAHRSKVDFDVGVGLAIAAGYRHNSYIAGEVGFRYSFAADTDDFTKLDGIDIGEDDDSKTLKEFEVTFDLKGYPLGYFDVSAMPDWVQPYAMVGVGFGETTVGNLKELRFLMRFGGGFEVLITDRLGVYLDGGYSVITGTVRENGGTILDGHGQLGIGALVRF